MSSFIESISDLIEVEPENNSVPFLQDTSTGVWVYKMISFGSSADTLALRDGNGNSNFNNIYTKTEVDAIINNLGPGIGTAPVPQNKIYASPANIDGLPGFRYLETEDVPELPELVSTFPTSNSQAEIQAFFDDVSTHASGYVQGFASVTGNTTYLRSGIITSSTPLFIGSGCSIIGKGVGVTIFKYTGTGAAVRFFTYGGHGSHNKGHVLNMTIISDGDGVSINNPLYIPGSVNGEASDCTLENLVIDCAGTALLFDHPNLMYWINIFDVLVTGWGTRVIKIGGTTQGVGFRIRKLKFSNNSRSMRARGHVTSATSTTLVLGTADPDFPPSGTDDFYNGMQIWTYNSGGTLINRKRILDYTGSTKTVTVAGWTTLPDNTYTYQVMWIQTVSNCYFKGTGTIADCNFESDIDQAPSVEFDAATLNWEHGHVETHLDNDSPSNAVYIHNHSVISSPNPEFLLPKIFWKVYDHSILSFTGDMQPQDNGGTPFANGLSWNQTLDIDGTSKVFLRGIDVGATYMSATPKVLVSFGDGTVDWSSSLPGGIGGSGTTSYLHTQGIASTTWTINHALGYNPSVTVLDGSGNEIYANVFHNSTSQLTLSFTVATSGKAYLI